MPISNTDWAIASAFLGCVAGYAILAPCMIMLGVNYLHKSRRISAVTMYFIAYINLALALVMIFYYVPHVFALMRRYNQETIFNSYISLVGALFSLVPSIWLCSIYEKNLGLQQELKFK